MSKKDRGGIPTPNVIDPPESMSVTLCIPKNVDHMKAFFGALWELTMWNNWQPDAAHTGKELAAVWYRYWLSWDRTMDNFLDCEDGMAQCCIEPSVIRRINPETGVIEQSTNNGQTWSPAGGGIPSVIVQPIPPVTSGVAATKCDAATNVSGQVDVWIAQVSTDFDTATSLLEFAGAVLLAILTAVLVVLSAGALTPLEALVLPTLGAALVAAWGAGKAVFDAYWTVENKDIILCAAYCNMGADGSYTDAQFSAFWSECNGELPASPAKMLFMGFLSSVGKEGLNAMAASGMAADADCEDCGCEPFKVVFQNAGGNLDGTGVEIFPDEDGIYTVTCDFFYVNGYYGIVKFANNPAAHGYSPCANISIIDAGGSGAGYTWDCSTGDNNPLSTCWAGHQRYRNAPWTMTFTVVEPPCG